MEKEVAAQSSEKEFLILKTLEYKLYPTNSQAKTLTVWLGKCCWLYNLCLEQRIKTYKRRREFTTCYDQQKLLTGLRKRVESIRQVPVQFARSALRRIDKGMNAFLKRVKAKEKAGFPRFKSGKNYNSMEYLDPGKYVGCNFIIIPKLGEIKARGQFTEIKTQKLLRVIRRASGWYAQVLVEQPVVALPLTGQTVGIDLGLESFLTTDQGEHMGNPRHLRKTAKSSRKAQQDLARCKKGSNRRKKAVKRVARLHEKTARKRKGFCHRISREIVNKYDKIAVENLNVKGLAGGMLAKHVLDACWGTFLRFLTYKAANAGRELVKVDPNYTSQTCPKCGQVKKKKLSEREHICSSCGFRCHRDHAAAMIVRDRAFRPGRGGLVRPVGTLASPAKREDSQHNGEPLSKKRSCRPS